MSKVINTVEGLIWNQAVSLKNVFRGQDPSVVPVRSTSYIESKTISWISPTGCFFRTIVGSEPALGFFSGVVALEDIQHLDTTLKTGRK